jgi:hypothetical protein
MRYWAEPPVPPLFSSRIAAELSYSSLIAFQNTSVPSTVVPTQNSESAQRIPAARPADAGLQLQWNVFGMKEVQRPAPVLVAALHHGFDGVSEAVIGFGSCIPQIIESAQDIVVPKRREREAEPAFVDDFAGSERTEHAALKQIVFAPFTGLNDGGRFAPRSFVFEEPFEHADGGMERRTAALGCFAVPAAIFELLAQESRGQCLVRFLEIRADGENSAIDAGLRFAVKERPVVEGLKHQPLVDAVDHFTSLPAGGVETEVLQDDKRVEGNQQARVLLWQIVSAHRGAHPPVAGRRLEREKSGSPAFSCDARPLGRDRLGDFAGEIPHDLPADGRIGIEEPFEVRGPGRIVMQAHRSIVAISSLCAAISHSAKICEGIMSCPGGDKDSGHDIRSTSDADAA